MCLRLKFYCVNALQDIHEEMFKFFEKRNIIYLCFIQYIYNTRCLKKNLSFQALQEKLKDMHNIEKMLAVRNKCLAQFSQTWNIYKGILY